VASAFIEALFIQMRFYADVGNVALALYILVIVMFTRSKRRPHNPAWSSHSLLRRPEAALCVNIVWFCSFLAVALFIPNAYVGEFLSELSVRWLYVMFPLVPFVIMVGSLVLRFALRDIKIQPDVEGDTPASNVAESTVQDHGASRCMRTRK
jgi:hypothetical protein